MEKKETAGKQKSVITPDREKKKGVITPDIAVKDYWSGNREFADLFNAVLFRGEEVIRPEELTADDTEASVLLEDNMGQPAESIRGARDILKIFRRSTAWGGVQLAILVARIVISCAFCLPVSPIARRKNPQRSPLRLRFLRRTLGKTFCALCTSSYDTVY